MAARRRVRLFNPSGWATLLAGLCAVGVTGAPPGDAAVAAAGAVATAVPHGRPLRGGLLLQGNVTRLLSGTDGFFTALAQLRREVEVDIVL